MALQPVSLTGRYVDLIPLRRDHHEGLVQAVSDGELWKLWYTNIPAADEMAAEIERRLDLQAKGLMLPFTVIQKQSGQVVGMTTYMNIAADLPRVEIGSTWYAASVQGTPLNTEAKLLLLSHAFDQLECPAVELRTHYMNQQSRRAIERLGAKLDGILRQQSRMRDGTIRDTCVYSIIASEWPSVRSGLKWKLENHR